MSLTTPSTADVSANILSQVEAKLGQTVPLLPKAFLRVLSNALGGVFILLYKYAGFTFLQMFVATATMEETTVNGRTIQPLVEWGRLVGVGDPTAATRAELVVEVTVTQVGGVLPAGSQLLFSSTGVVYQTTASIDLDASTKQVVIRASSDPSGGGGAGVIGNLAVNDILSFASPLSNVARDAKVVSQQLVAADAESVDSYRTRIIRRFQRPPQGGAYADYRAWGEEDGGILNIYPYTGDDPGEVDVYVEATVASSGSPDGIPTAGQLSAVADLIELDQGGLASRRPVGAAVNVLAITRTAFDVEITGLSVDDVPAAEAALEAALDEYLRAREPFIVGLSVLPRRDRVTDAAISGVADDVVSALGGSITSVAVERLSVPISAYSLVKGEKAKLGTVTYV